MATRVLIVDTDEAFRLNLQSRLQESGYEAHASGREETAKQRLTTTDYQVVLLGLRGFQRRGLLLLDQIRESRPRARVITMIPGNQVQLAIEAMKRGADDDILVPFDLRTLLEKIEISCRPAGEEGRPGDSSS